jgi:hypothetical protein
MYPKQKTEHASESAKSPPRVRPRLTDVQSQYIGNREGSPTKERMRQALQAQTAPSGQVVKTIRA